MTRNKPPENIRSRREPKPSKREKEHPPSQFPRSVKVLLEVLGSIASILGVLALIPRISLAPTGSLRPHDPMGTVFAITNDSVLPIHNVHARCVLDDLRSGPMYIHGIAVAENGADAATLSSGQQLTLPCSRVETKQPVRVAKVTIRVDYRPDFLWWDRTTRFSMEAMPSQDGTWVWKRLPR